MARDYEMIKYIRQQMQNYDDRFTNAVIKLFNKMVDTKEPNGCLSNSAMLLACARYCGYNAKLCYGLCDNGKHEIYHAWLEIEDRIFDIGIYGNSHFSPLYLDEPLERPVINCRYNDAPINYGRFVFDKDWKDADLSRAENLTMEQYFDNSERHILWQLVCSLLDLSPIPVNGEKIRDAIKNIVIKPE